MIVLALDTCLAACSAALIRDHETLGFLSEPMTRGHQERLAPMVRELVAPHDGGFATVDRIGVTLGPGSFTGLRVGLAFAKGLALALGKACVGVGTLEALSESLGIRGPRSAIIDAGRGRVYLQLFDGLSSLGGPEILPVDQAVARLLDTYGSAQVALTGPGAALVASGLPRASLEARAAPDPRVVARLALSAPVTAPHPIYLRPPDAVIKAA